MHVLIIGAAGRLGRGLTAKLFEDGEIVCTPITRLTLYDLIPPPVPEETPFPVEALAGDFASFGEPARLVNSHPDVIFQLAAALPAHAEAEFDAGYRLNLDGNRQLFEAIRATKHCPRLVFASSYVISPAADGEPAAPTGSYAVQKAIIELLIEDYSRRGFIDGVAPRLAAIFPQEGPRAGATTGYLSEIVRAAFDGSEAVVPVPEDLAHWVASSETTIAQLVHAASIATEGLAGRRAIAMPGLTTTVREIADALEKITGRDTADHIRFAPDDEVTEMVSSWPAAVDTGRAGALDFPADDSVEAILRAYGDDFSVSTKL